MVEYCWNVYPSTLTSSLLLHACHLTLLTTLFIYPRKPENISATKAE